MRRLACFLVWIALVAPAAARAQPQFVFGARGGVSNPHEVGFEWGPLAGVEISWAMHRLAALELVVDQSFHSLQPAQEGAPATSGNVTVGNLGIQYRIDITPRFVPYAVLAVESRWVRRAGASTENRYGGAFAVGILAPFADRWFAGVEARYGISGLGQFPVRQAYVAKVGFSTARF